MEVSPKEIIKTAMDQGRTTLSEYESKKILSTYRIPVTREVLVANKNEMLNAVKKIGYPVVLKGCSYEAVHKTEKDLIRVDIRNKEEAGACFEEIMNNMGGGENAVLVQELVKGQRELVAGLTRDPQFGPWVFR